MIITLHIQCQICHHNTLQFLRWKVPDHCAMPQLLGYFCYVVTALPITCSPSHAENHSHRPTPFFHTNHYFTSLLMNINLGTWADIWKEHLYLSPLYMEASRSWSSLERCNLLTYLLIPCSRVFLRRQQVLS